MSISIRVSRSSGGGDLARFRFMKAAVGWADEVGPLVRAGLKAKAPVAKQGAGAGRLRDSIRYERNTTSGGVTLSFTAYVPYAKYVIEGTPPHLIRARAARYLHWKDGSGDHFAKQVNHPGTRPNDFPRRAIGPLEPLIRKRFAEILNQALGGQ